jgi:site-specific DNA recombinase
MWMGGWTPLGYEVRDRKLVIHKEDAERVRSIFKRFVQLKSATLLARELVVARATNRYGQLLDKGVLYRILTTSRIRRPSFQRWLNRRRHSVSLSRFFQ